MHVLIVDDDELVRMNLELVLSLEGYQVGTADSGMAALRIIETRQTDLVVLDITMPGMNGWETIRQLRSRRETAGLPVVALSADRRDPAAFRRAGFNAYLPKGDSLDRFLSIIRAAFEMNVGPERMWLQASDGGRCMTSPISDSPSNLPGHPAPAEAVTEYLTGITPISHHATMDGPRHLTPRV